MRSFTLISLLIASLAAKPISPPAGQSSGNVGILGANGDNSQLAADINRKREGKPSNTDSTTVFGNQVPESQAPPTSNNNVDTQDSTNVFGNQGSKAQVPPTSAKSNIDTQDSVNSFGNQVPKPQSPPTSGNNGVDIKDSTNIFGSQDSKSQVPPTSGKSEVDSNAERIIMLQKKITELYLEYENEVAKVYGNNANNMLKPSSDDSINSAQSPASGISKDGLDGSLNGEGGEVEEGKGSPENDSSKLGDFGPTNSSNQDNIGNPSTNIPTTDIGLSPAGDSNNGSLKKSIPGNSEIKVDDKPQSTEQVSLNDPNSSQSSNTSQAPREKVEIQSNISNKVMLREGPHGF